MVKLVKMNVMRKKVILIHNLITARTMDNLGKDIRTVASGVVGVGDSAEVYAVMTVISYQLSIRRIVMLK